MSLFVRRARVEQRDQMTDTFAALRSARVSGTWSGVPVTPEAALSVPAVWACTQLTAGFISQLPFDEFRKVGDERQELPPSPLLVTPAADVPIEDWLFQAVESAQLHGSAYGMIVARDRGFWPTQIELIHPNRVQARYTPDRRLQWKVDGSIVDPADMWRMTGRPELGSPLGLPLLEYIANAAGTGIAARRYSAEWFVDGGAPPAVIKPERDPGQAGAEALKQRVIEAIRSRRPVVIPSDVEVTAWGGRSTPAEAELVQLLRSNATDIAMFYQVPAELVGGQAGDSMTYSNLDARVLNLLVFGVSYWLTKLERSLTRCLPAGRFVKANERAMIRTDIKTQTDVFTAEIRAGIRTPNEARSKLDLPPVPNGDDTLWPPYSTSTPVDVTPGGQ